MTESTYTLEGIYYLAQHGSSRPHTESTITWDCSSLARYTLSNCSISQHSAPLESKAMTSGLGIAGPRGQKPHSSQPCEIV